MKHPYYRNRTHDYENLTNFIKRKSVTIPTSGKYYEYATCLFVLSNTLTLLACTLHNYKCRIMVLAVSNVLTASIFSNSRNFETEGDTTRKLKPN